MGKKAKGKKGDKTNLEYKKKNQKEGGKRNYRNTSLLPSSNISPRRAKKQKGISQSPVPIMKTGIFQGIRKHPALTAHDAACLLFLNLNNGANPESAHAFFKKSC
jgi:hypothetical protein